MKVSTRSSLLAAAAFVALCLVVELVDASFQPMEAAAADGTTYYSHSAVYYTRNYTMYSYAPVVGDTEPGYYTAAKVILAILMFLSGVLFCFGGYRLFRSVILLLGFLFFAIFSFLVIYSLSSLEWYWVLLICLPLGILGAVLFHCLYLVGVFCVGLVLGFLLGMVLMGFVNYYVGDDVATTMWFIAVTWAVIFTFAIIAAFVTVQFQRALLIIGTSVGGAYLIVATFDYMISDGSFSTILVNVFSGAYQDFKTGWVAYLMVLLWIVLSIIGIISQFQLTAKGYRHVKSKPRAAPNEQTIINIH